MSEIVPRPPGAVGGYIHHGFLRSDHWDRLTRLSDRLVESIAAQPLDSHADQHWYVPRGIEPALLDRLELPGVTPQIVVGEAGHGKSTLLWSLHRALQERKRRPMMVSATWLQRSEDGSRTTSTADIAEAVVTEPGAVLLLDTADLLLHNESTRLDVVDLLDQLTRAGVPVVATTRPQESAYLPASVGQKVHLGPYSIERELPSAIAVLTEEFCADDASVPTDPLTAITSARARGLLVDEVCTSPLLLGLGRVTTAHASHLSVVVPAKRATLPRRKSCAIAEVCVRQDLLTV
ncbi:hypothetical protein [Rhodococcoides fascians]|uniref:hypothetical protein n=1 Tax=Rhodococcoides fascians TaxID=1828 RepID=UPI00056156B1|nr:MULTISPECIES: hypothetical protein [Rhodococcus]OZE97433.1 hypothetical protein CH301_17860 [Rhodococcus sp. 15-1189-1-1a]OZF12127.1 hypothetical protein CH299_18555 [Rhodococcus sp. 14-2686-1-2]